MSYLTNLASDAAAVATVEAKADSKYQDGKSRSTSNTMGKASRWHENCIQCVHKALSGDIALLFLNGTTTEDEDITAAVLNAAAAGTLKRRFRLKLSDAGKNPHLWASFAPVLTPAEAATDADIGVPSVDSPSFVHGKLTVTVTFDTDAGATKTYAAADSVSCDIQVAADDKWLGHSVTKITKTYNVV